ncbi:hypothetical protein PISMIDRAFT_437954 [Pisolithus microcarpus 441]|uniref:Uncharacterized protein n=1 Tax=Pisolithus microcarpus 441 TaxID=765257 RepID=A0A0C9YX31_9AGAM|nr:hypothetical protein PISMIDRAFT_437954 [Pisolithus microcarpus 441]
MRCGVRNSSLRWQVIPHHTSSQPTSKIRKMQYGGARPGVVQYQISVQYCIC